MKASHTMTGGDTDRYGTVTKDQNGGYEKVLLQDQDVSTHRESTQETKYEAKRKGFDGSRQEQQSRGETEAVMDRDVVREGDYVETKKVDQNGAVHQGQERYVGVKEERAVEGKSIRHESTLSKDSKGRETEHKKIQLSHMEKEGEATHGQISTMDAVQDKSGHVKSEYSQQKRSQGVAEGKEGTLILEQREGPNGLVQRHEQQLKESGRKVEAASDTDGLVEGQKDQNGNIKVERVKTTGLQQVNTEEYQEKYGEVRNEKVQPNQD